ncbi:MAG: hypothetical protein AcusKO_01350 [Acuticoccus sp.]
MVSSAGGPRGLQRAPRRAELWGKRTGHDERDGHALRAAIGRGDLDTRIADRGRDEIAALARSFAGMRNSIRALVDELRRANETLEDRVEARTREVTAAQQKLVDAIESTSEGFAFFNVADELVLHNARYQALLYGDAGADIRPGMTFEEILRTGIDSGVINVEGDDVEAFIARRLEQHRNPGTPVLQRRLRGNWIQINERKTSDGGTVAVFSDITELVEVKGIAHPIDVYEVLVDGPEPGAARVVERQAGREIAVDLTPLSPAERARFAEMLKTVLSRLADGDDADPPAS